MIKRLWNGPYTRTGYLAVTSVGAALISGALIPAVGILTYQGQTQIPGAVLISETLFTGFLITYVTAVILHRHASKDGVCGAIAQLKFCPFPAIFAIGLGLGAIAVGAVVMLLGSGDQSYETMLRAKLWQGLLTGLIVPPLFYQFSLLRHPQVKES